jgi:hypothetical protein
MRSRLIKGWKGEIRERWVLGRWSHQMNQEESRVEGEHPSSGGKGKGFGIAFQSVIRVQKRIQNPPRQWHQNVIAQVVGWENPNPNHNMVTTKRTPTHCHLR